MIEPRNERLPSVRMTQTELDRLLKAAEVAGVRPSDFIRKALEEKVNRLAGRFPELAKAV